MLLKARELGILQDVDSHLLPDDTKIGTCTITCADCDQFLDIFTHHSEKCCNHRHQIFSLNGGSLLCNPDRQEPIAIMKRGIYINDIREACEMKSIKIVSFYAHNPCGIAKKLKLSIWDILDHLVKAKKYMKETALLDLTEGGLKYMCFFHLDKGRGTKRTYFVNPQKWARHKDELKSMLD